MNKKSLLYMLSAISLLFSLQLQSGEASAIRVVRGGSSPERVAHKYVVTLLKNDYRGIWKLLSSTAQKQIDQLVADGKFANRQAFLEALISEGVKALKELYGIEKISEIADDKDIVREIVEMVLKNKSFLIKEGDCWVISLTFDPDCSVEDSEESADNTTELTGERALALRSFFEAVAKKDHQKVWDFLEVESQKKLDNIVAVGGVFVDRKEIVWQLIVKIQQSMLNVLEIDDIAEAVDNDKLINRLVNCNMDWEYFIEVNGKYYISNDIIEDTLADLGFEKDAKLVFKPECADSENAHAIKIDNVELLKEVEHIFREKNQNNDEDDALSMSGEDEMPDSVKVFFQKYTSIVLSGDLEALWQCFSPLSKQMVEKLVAEKKYASRDDFLQKYLSTLQTYIKTQIDVSDLQDLTDATNLVIGFETEYCVIELDGEYFLSFDPVSEKYNIPVEQRALCRKFLEAVMADDANTIWQLLSPEMQETVDDIVEATLQYPNRIAFVRKFIGNMRTVINAEYAAVNYQTLLNDNFSYFKVEAAFLYGSDTIFVRSNGKWFVDATDGEINQSSREDAAFSLVHAVGRMDAESIRALLAPDYVKNLSETELFVTSFRFMADLNKIISQQCQVTSWRDVLEDADKCTQIAEKVISTKLVNFTQSNGKWFVEPVKKKESK